MSGNEWLVCALGSDPSFKLVCGPEWIAPRMVRKRYEPEEIIAKQRQGCQTPAAEVMLPRGGLTMRITIGALAALAVSAGAAQAQSTAFTLQRAEAVCVMSSNFTPVAGSDQLVTVGYARGLFMVGIFSPDWQSIEVRRNYPLVAVFKFAADIPGARDVEFPLTGRGFDAGEDGRGFNASIDDRFLNHFAGAERLTIKRGGRPISEIDLSGSSRVFREFRQCASEVEQRTRPRDPFAD